MPKPTEQEAADIADMVRVQARALNDARAEEVGNANAHTIPEWAWVAASQIVAARIVVGEVAKRSL